MIVTGYTIPIKYKGDKISLIPIGDEHLFSKNCRLDKLKELISWIGRTPNTYWIHMGDMCEFINTSDPRFDARNMTGLKVDDLADLPKAEADSAIELYKPIAHKCIGKIEGNHERKVLEKYQFDIQNYICAQLKIQDLSFDAIIRLSLKYARKINAFSQNVFIFATHGTGGGRFLGAKINRMHDFAKFLPQCDIYIAGHVHDKAIDKATSLGCTVRGTPRLVEKTKVFVVSGTFYQTYTEDTSSYAERAGFPPSRLGVVKITIQGFRKHYKNYKEITHPPNIHVSL